MSFQRFVFLWTDTAYPPDRVTAKEIEDAERRLGMSFPSDYREAVLETGLPRPTIALLDAVVDRGADVRSISDFLAPEEIVGVTEDWRELGLSEDLVAFATDYTGNLFCFPVGSREAELPVFFFDHDEGTTEIVASSFSRWISEYCTLAPHEALLTRTRRADTS